MTTRTVSRRESAAMATPQWLRTFLVVVVIVVLGIGVLGYTVITTGVVSFTPAVMPVLPIAVQMRPVENQAQPVQALAVQAPVAAAPAVQPVIVPAAPAEWPLMQVEWKEVPPTPGVYLLNPIEGDGFYTGTMNTPSGFFTSTPEGLAYLKAHFPQIEKAVMVAAARDTTNKNIVFVSIVALDPHRSYLFLSVDGEKTWYKLNLATVDTPAIGSGAVRVSVEGDFIRLTAKDNSVQERWFGGAISKSGL